MAFQKLGKVRASGGRVRRVDWDDKRGEVYVEGKPGLFGGGGMRRIGILAKTSSDAMNYAQGWLNQDMSR